ncbi:MAG TPA: patatin-like phospholipase family protein [Polyangia bacterium]|nr:patatin-like phospholipase family protein [Polyangia bacterium]
MAAIQQRAARWKAGDRSPDGRQLALVVEGGALRGVCSAGGVVALEHLGLTEVFDHVYGTSAGVMNACYFVAGQAQLGIRIYYEDMNRREIVNPWRFWRILDLDRLFGQTILGAKRLRLESVLTARSKLFIAALEAETGTGRLFDAQALGSSEGLLAALRGATAVPFLYNRPSPVEGRRCLDAGLVNAFPVVDAVAAGCTDILVLLTRPFGYRRPRAGRFMRWLFNRLCAHGNPQLARAYALRHQRDAALRDLAFGRSPTPAGVNIATICTDDGESVQRTTTDRAVLRGAAVAFGRKTLRVLGADPDGWELQ